MPRDLTDCHPVKTGSKCAACGGFSVQITEKINRATAKRCPIHLTLCVKMCVSVFLLSIFLFHLFIAFCKSITCIFLCNDILFLLPRTSEKIMMCKLYLTKVSKQMRDVSLF